MLEAMLNSTAEQCRAAGELFLAPADRPRDIHFKADLQRRLDELPVPPKSDFATALEAARRRLAEREAELWRVGWHPSQILQHLKATGFSGVAGQHEPPVIADLIELHRAISDAGFGALIWGDASDPYR